ncbi:ATP-citrate synthase beta chain protein 1-like [Capsicum annuum]|uniref:ATP-citrate synthase beta chain protein 1-like n=1 Tax=Capsicum annuum TaxID=4072 RepID=UPI001FB14CFE|nr:ATP-citrate synthase beta chain protein 1-like [Capsicum annuum]
MFLTELKGLDLQAGLLTLKQIKAATKNFGPDKKVGEGDFGSVYKGAKSGREMESVQAKNQALRDVGAMVPTSYESFEGTIKEAFENLF